MGSSAGEPGGGKTGGGGGGGGGIIQIVADKVFIRPGAIFVAPGAYSSNCASKPAQPGVIEIRGTHTGLIGLHTRISEIYVFALLIANSRLCSVILITVPATRDCVFN